MLIVKFEEWTVMFWGIGNIAEVIREVDVDVEAQQGKRRRAHELVRLEMGGEFDTTTLGTTSQEDTYICGKGGGTDGFACHKFRCFRFGERGHVHCDCMKDHICFYCH